jgi:iron complex outermembrane receptor protein
MREPFRQGGTPPGKKPSRSRLRSVLPSLLGVGLTLGFGLAGETADAAQARTGTIRVEVVAGATPIEGANVSANGVSVATDTSGVGTLTLPPGSVSVVATRFGYQMSMARGEVVAGAERTVRLVLLPESALQESTRTRRRFEDQASPVALIEREQIVTAMLRTPGDIVSVFSEMPGVRTQTTSSVLGMTSLRLRGLPGHYTRLVANGMPLFFDRPGGHALLRVPPMDLGRVEVIKEPASALFGADAVGVVNLLSRRPDNGPSRELLFNQSSRGATDALLWIASPPKGSWSSTFLFAGNRQKETDVDDDGWSDLPGYERAVVHPRVTWDNKQGRSVAGTANVTFEKREGGSAFAREALETKTADGSLSGQMVFRGDYIIGGAAMLFVQSRTRDFSDLREGDRLQTATIELTLRRPTPRHTWLAGIASDWYALRSGGPLPSTYVSTRPGIFVHDDLNAAPWLVLSGSLRLDHHNLYGLLLSPRGSALLRDGRWSARVSASRGYFTPRPHMDETEAAGVSRLSIDGELEVETARSVSADFSHTTRATTVTLTLFRTQIDDPAQIDRATYTLRTEPDPILTRGVEILGTARLRPFSVTGTYTYVKTRERGGRELALTPRHSAGVIAAAEGHRGRIGVQVLLTGEQRLDRNPYRSASEPYAVAGLLGEYRFGRWRVFVNADNLTDVRQTDWDPIARPARDIDGRWTVDVWAPLKGRVINGGLRVLF